MTVDRVHTKSTILNREQLESLVVTSSLSRCKACANNCLLTINQFSDDTGVKRRFTSGNRCERVLSGGGDRGRSPLQDIMAGNSGGGDRGRSPVQGQNLISGRGWMPVQGQVPNLFAYKYKRVFDYVSLDESAAPRGVVGIPRVLNMYENYPLWFTFLTELGYCVKLSPETTREVYEEGMESMPSESVCYPAKLAHGHIVELLKASVRFIFYPGVVYEKPEGKADGCYNCPIVASYPENIKLNVEEIRRDSIDFRNPFLTLEKEKALFDGLCSAFPEIPKREIRRALKAGLLEQERFKQDMRAAGRGVLEYLKKTGGRGVVLAGRPYHVDPEIHHGIPEMIVGFGVAVLTEDSVLEAWESGSLGCKTPRLRVRDQWTYHSRLYKAARVVCDNKNLEMIQLNSFGCGLDAVTTDEVQEIINGAGKIYTCLKIDEVNNLGSARIRVRSLLAALKARTERRAVIEDLVLKEYRPVLYTREAKGVHTVLSPQMSPVHFELLEQVFQSEGHRLVVLPAMDREAVDVGLRYCNNDACYPAIIVVGQLLRAIQSGEYDTDNLSVIMSQTGGGCRASNYVGFIRKALKKAGFEHIPVIAISAQGFEKHPGMKYSFAFLKKAAQALIYGDLMMRVVYAVRPYEAEKGSVNRLSDLWMERLKKAVRKGSGREYRKNTYEIVRDFDNVEVLDIVKPKVGVVGEILVKFHPTANNDIVGLLEAEGAEAVVPDLTDFFLYGFLNSTYKHKYFGYPLWVRVVTETLIGLTEFYRRHAVRALSASKRFHPPVKIKELAKLAKPIVSLGNQSGEGWFLTAEMVELIQSGVKNIVCAQPFACLPNHITGKGIIKELRRVWPGANVVAVDYDPGASEVNQLNRIKLMLGAGE